MFIAQQKRKENIAEYILYLWQLEDVLRALSFDENKIKAMLVEPVDATNEKKQEAYWWYMGIAGLLKDENKQASGHSNHSLHLINDLNDIHLYLLNKAKDEAYRTLYYKAQPDILLFKEKMGNERISDVEACFHALYSKLLLGLKHEQISDETQEAFTSISRLIAYLSAKYHRFERGEESMDKLDE